MAGTYINSEPRVSYGKPSDAGVDWTYYTRRRLTWHYGDARAQQIIAGKDPNTQRDIASWKRLCALGRAR